MRKKVTRMTIFLFLSKRKPNSIDLSIDTGYLNNVLHNVFHVLISVNIPKPTALVARMMVCIVIHRFIGCN